MNKEQKIFFLGCGKMGSILLGNLIDNGSVEPAQVTVLKKTDKNKIAGISYVKSVAELQTGSAYLEGVSQRVSVTKGVQASPYLGGVSQRVSVTKGVQTQTTYQADLVFVAVKPQDSEKILREFFEQKIFHKDTIFVSILAGKKLEFFAEIFGKKAKVIRSMPNLPIQYSQGVFPYLPNKNVTKLEVKNLQKIFEKFGSAFVVENEKEFDVLTAIFGSGPAYIFLLEEIFTEIAVGFGVRKDRACELVRKLFLGSVLMSEFSGVEFTKLRESVTSKGGTTEAALNVLQKNSVLKKLFTQAVTAAVKKSTLLAE